MHRLALAFLAAFALYAYAQSTPAPAPDPAKPAPPGAPPADASATAASPEKPAAPATSPAKPAAPTTPPVKPPAPATPPASTATPASSPPTAATPKLSGLKSGKWVGQNAVFQSKNFDAILSTDRVLSIQPKVDGKPMGGPVVMGFGMHYSNGHHNVACKLVNIERQTPPAMQPSRVEFQAVYDRKEKCNVRVHFGDSGITFSGDVKDPPKLKFPTVLTYSITFGRSHDIGPDTPIEEMKKLTEGYTVKIYEPNRVQKLYGYWDAIPTRGNVAEAQVIGHWGPRRLSIEMPATRENDKRFGAFHNYKVHRFFKGEWGFYRQGTDAIVPGPLILRVD
jgi:hypothetical protein